MMMQMMGRGQSTVFIDSEGWCYSFDGEVLSNNNRVCSLAQGITERMPNTTIVEVKLFNDEDLQPAVPRSAVEKVPNIPNGERMIRFKLPASLDGKELKSRIITEADYNYESLSWVLETDQYLLPFEIPDSQDHADQIIETMEDEGYHAIAHHVIPDKHIHSENRIERGYIKLFPIRDEHRQHFSDSTPL